MNWHPQSIPVRHRKTHWTEKRQILSNEKKASSLRKVKLPTLFLVCNHFQLQTVIISVGHCSTCNLLKVVQCSTHWAAPSAEQSLTFYLSVSLTGDAASCSTSDRNPHPYQARKLYLCFWIPKFYAREYCTSKEKKQW